MFFKANFFSTVNSGDYIQAVIDRNLAENISRVLYPNDNVSVCLLYGWYSYWYRCNEYQHTGVYTCFVGKILNFATSLLFDHARCLEILLRSIEFV